MPVVSWDCFKLELKKKLNQRVAYLAPGDLKAFHVLCDICDRGSELVVGYPDVCKRLLRSHALFGVHHKKLSDEVFCLFMKKNVIKF